MSKVLSNFSIHVIISLCLFVTHAQSQTVKIDFFKSLSFDPIITLHNSSASTIECLVINYKIDGSQMQQYKFTGILHAHTSTDIPLPRMQVSNGMHFFDASVVTSSGVSLKNTTDIEGLSFTLSPWSKDSLEELNSKSAKKISKEKFICLCEDGNGLSEDISFWVDIFLNDHNKLDAFGSTTKGSFWFQGLWNKTAGLDNEWSSADFTDPDNQDRVYVVNISTAYIPESINSIGLSSDFSLEQNAFCSAYPNPFTNNVKIQYYLIDDAKVDIVITNISGIIQAYPMQQLWHAKGNYTFDYSALELSEGFYWCTITSGNKKHTIKLIKK